MGLSHNPKIVKDGLVLILDAANAKSTLSAVEVLVVAGGGAGGGGIGGGGGGGGVIHMPAASIIPGTAYTITVGAGGASAVYPTSSSNGGNSSAFGATAAGGGGSGVHDTGVGLAGGSGGGAASNNGALNQGGASSGNSLGTNAGFIYGNRGGNMLNSRTAGPTAAAGGGGAGTIAADVNSNIVLSVPGTAQGRGGDGIPNSILGTLYYWGGGGGGGAYLNGYAGDGGLGGGGGGSCTSGTGPTSGGASALNSGVGAAVNANGGNGGANTGGGGGGGSWQTTSGGNGGSGIVVVRYKGSQRASGGTISFVNGYTTHTFTTSSTFTPSNTWADISNNGNTATIMNGVGYSSANKGSFVFDGTVGKQATVTYDSANFVNTNFTWIAWVLGQGSPTVNMPQIGYGSGSWPRLGFLENAGTWYFQQYNASGPPATSSVSCGASSNTVWKQICCVGSYSSSQILGYNNGSYVAAAPFIDSSGNYSTLGIGRAGTTYEPWNEAFLGNISAIQIYNRALTAQEIQQNFNTLRGRFGI